VRRLIDIGLWVTWLVAVLTCFVVFCALVEPDQPIVSRMVHARRPHAKGGRAPARGSREWWDGYWGDQNATPAGSLGKPLR